MGEEPLLLEDGIPVGNVYDKYHTRNPVARWLMEWLSPGLLGVG